MCPQQMLMSQKIEGDENCLHLFIYTRHLKPTTLAPVMVCIHDGTFANGNASSDIYNPEYLLYHGIVFVAINYRLGIFGKISTL